jgi:Arc/MetJ-type ribon-helix-helix transcriptional regulator
MKTSTIPAIRVEPALRAELERLLNEGETISEFVEQSVRTALQRRVDQGEFIARGMASLDRAREANEYIGADTVITGLQRKLDEARTKQAKNRV